jgi:hypothetical protein
MVGTGRMVEPGGARRGEIEPCQFAGLYRPLAPGHLIMRPSVTRSRVGDGSSAPAAADTDVARPVEVAGATTNDRAQTRARHSAVASGTSLAPHCPTSRM